MVDEPEDANSNKRKLTDSVFTAVQARLDASQELAK